MRKILLFFCMLAVVPCVCGAYVEHDVAIVRVMNKAAGKVQELALTVNEEVQFEKLYINVRSCKQTDPFQAEDFFAFVEINKIDEGQIFGGWMSRNEPGQNPLQNADYDVWLVRCE